MGMPLFHVSFPSFLDITACSLSPSLSFVHIKHAQSETGRGREISVMCFMLLKTNLLISFAEDDDGARAHSDFHHTRIHLTNQKTIVVFGN